MQFDIKVTIPEVYMGLRRADNRQVVEFVMDTMTVQAQKGFTFVNVDFALHTCNLIDHISESKLYPNLLETRMPLQTVLSPSAL